MADNTRASRGYLPIQFVNAVLIDEQSGTTKERDMSEANAQRITFLELAKRVLEKVGKPITAGEIWAMAEQMGITALLKSKGKTPEQTLSARLYVDVQNPSSLFVKYGASPAKFLLKSLATTFSDPHEEMPLPIEIKPKQKAAYNEKKLHPLLIRFAYETFGAHCKTIYHEESTKKGEKQNEWIHPDIVGFFLTTGSWEHEVVQLSQISGAPAARFFSFELKIALDFPNLRQSFFQAVSNSSWAHEGYLVAVDIDKDQAFQTELARLSQSFGIGVIQMSISNLLDSEVLLPARKRMEIDWETVDRIVRVNPGFSRFIASVASSIKINQPVTAGFDELFSDDKLETYLQGLQDKS